MSSVSIKAVLIGAVVDIAASTILSFVLIFAFGIWLGITEPDQMQRLAESPDLYLASYFVGGLVSVFAGYLAARIAGRGEVINGTIATLIPIIGSLVINVVAAPEMLSPMMLFACYVVAPFFGVLGGYLRYRQVH
ncbi:MAG TPA: hypothetical protein VG742_21425 [Dongiaceae bacterium]|nr:hypothetical protein [Dongiaceae bacterium]